MTRLYHHNGAKTQSGFCPIHYGFCSRNGGGAASKFDVFGSIGGTLDMTATTFGEKTGGLVSAGTPFVNIGNWLVVATTLFVEMSGTEVVGGYSWSWRLRWSRVFVSARAALVTASSCARASSYSPM